ncbi:AAA family ATPase [Pseudomonas chlororaphis]|uniref:AAA family ATPase n=1 Tax=Pseudomonas chlororaphis TaxID=587753 RepID=UPI00209AF344|nr:AAA family ATPase [Pseudomonas chlororaphis]MCO7573063.1 AAA family ATPase [Pseudomonas chlororaphis]MCO7591578.1 AAA family ATPase [Pseudomonas chlororaphis]
MALVFTVTSTSKRRTNHVTLRVNNWDDFGFKTQFFVSYHDSDGEEFDLGSVKIGRVGQKEGWTKDGLDTSFDGLGGEYFSLGQDLDYYSNLASLDTDIAKEILIGLQDVVWLESRLDEVKGESVFVTSLLRYTSMSSILHQFKRILDGGSALTSFDFEFERKATKKMSAMKLAFAIEPGSKPPTNMHVLIGRNGVGKTTVLNQMVRSVIEPGRQLRNGQFYNLDGFGKQPISDSYFSCVISVSFSAFDPFDPPGDQRDSAQGVRNFYVGLKSIGGEGLKGLDDLCEDFISSFHACIGSHGKRDLWVDSVAKLNSDVNFKEIGILDILPFMEDDEFDQRLSDVYLRMSSGHAIVLLTLTRLIAHIEEKTLILLDEPESHLHPPLLSAFTRTLSDLLIERNGVAIIATHSPVVLQEVPRSCVWKLHRVRLEGGASRPENETFGENVGTLTREVFGLEVANSGFHAMLRDSVSEGKTYDQIISEYGGQLGFEGRSILRSLIASSNRSEADL